ASPELFAFPSRQICPYDYLLQPCRGSHRDSTIVLSCSMATESLTIDETKYYAAIFAASHIGSITVRITANANTATAKANATTRTLRCSNFPDALAKKSTVANKTVLARYCPETLPALRAFCRLVAALALASAASRVPRTSYSFGTIGCGSAVGFSNGF